MCTKIYTNIDALIILSMFLSFEPDLNQRPMDQKCFTPCLVCHKGREVMKRNEKYIFLYKYFTTRTMQRHFFTGWALTVDC